MTEEAAADSSFRKARRRVPRELAVIDGDRCTGCEACIEVCPVDCIAKAASRCGSPGWCEVDWDRCIGCRLCIRLPTKKDDPYQMQVCPWDAIEMVPPESLVAAAAGLGGPPDYVRQHRDRLAAMARRQESSVC